MNLSLSRQQWIAVIGGGCIILPLAYVVVLHPLIRDLQAKRTECVKYEADAADARAKILSYQPTGKERGFIEETRVAHAIDEITRLGTESGVIFAKVTPRALMPSSDGSHRVLPIEMEVSAAYQELAAFLGLLDDLETSLVTAQRFRIVREQDHPGRLRATLILNLHVQ